MEAFLTLDGWISLATLALLEIVLGIDNIVFIAILTNKLPEQLRRRGRTIGIALALIMRLLLLFAISWVMGLVAPLFAIGGHSFSGRDLILIFGGLFLLVKATREINHKVEFDLPEGDKIVAKKNVSFASVLIQITLLDIVFSLDSVITAVGMAQQISVMVAAMMIAVMVMLIFSGPISHFVNEHPSMQILALSFLMLIGVMLIVEGWGEHVNKGYIYFAMAFALTVDVLQLWADRKHHKPVKLRSRADENDVALETSR